MAIYIGLYKWTEQGIIHVKDSPGRAQANIKAVEALGGKVLSLWYTEGEYDMVAVTEWEDEDALNAFLTKQLAQGFVKVTPLRARTPAEFANIVEMLP
jgi:uncharacterized protein with GYD domain